MPNVSRLFSKYVSNMNLEVSVELHHMVKLIFYPNI